MDETPARGAVLNGVGWTLRDCALRFGAATVLERLNLQAEPGSSIALVGPSGCGKTTLLRLLGGALKPSSGSVMFTDGSGAEVGSAPFATAFCFQEPRLLPWLTALDNAALPLRLRGVPQAEARNKAQEQLDLVGLRAEGEKLPGALSGGMQMRVALARALVTHPQLLLLDEPFAAVDEIRRAALDTELRRLWEQLRFTLVLVTHSASEAAFVGERVCVLAAEGGRIATTLTTARSQRDARFRFGAEHQQDVASIVQALHESSTVGAA
ncbi:MAG: ATP-binding cassette domain-containing protein [Planctomycetes bacterium]|nr:ATP-binding cassette domain-containing protein [Planctomycetota bacterium]